MCFSPPFLLLPLLLLLLLPLPQVMSVVEKAKAATDQKNQSEVYKNIFGGGKAKKEDASKLFVSTAAPRHTIL